MATKIGPKTVTQRDRSKALVFCIDAAHSDSYGGEPADNLFADPNNFGGADWNQPAGTWAVSSDPGPHGNGSYSCTATNSDPYIYSNLVRDVATGNITFSCWVKGTGSTVGKSGDIRINFVAGGGNATGGNITQGWGPLSGNWQRVSVTQNVTGAGKIKVGIETPNSAVAGDVVYVSDPQLEQSQATTPFTATSRTTANAIKNISGVGAQGTTLTGPFATYGLGGLFRPTTRNVLASEDSNRGHIGAVYWDLDGTDEYIVTPVGFQVGNTRQKTIAMWVDVDSGVTLTMMGDNGNNYKWQWMKLNSHQPMNNASSYGTRYFYADTITSAGWTLVVDVVDQDQGTGNRVRRYIDGALVAVAYTSTDTGDSMYDGTDMYLQIGSANLSGSAAEFLNGRVANCMIWAAALTAKEVKDIYIAQKGRFGK